MFVSSRVCVLSVFTAWTCSICQRYLDPALPGQITRARDVKPHDLNSIVINLERPHSVPSEPSNPKFFPTHTVCRTGPLLPHRSLSPSPPLPLSTPKQQNPKSSPPNHYPDPDPDPDPTAKPHPWLSVAPRTQQSLCLCGPDFVCTESAMSRSTAPTNTAIAS